MYFNVTFCYNITINRNFMEKIYELWIKIFTT